jgi:hypothetical protein
MRFESKNIVAVFAALIQEDRANDVHRTPMMLLNFSKALSDRDSSLMDARSHTSYCSECIVTISTP